MLVQALCTSTVLGIGDNRLNLKKKKKKETTLHKAPVHWGRWKNKRVDLVSCH